MKLLALLTLTLSMLLAAPCFAQQQLVWPSNPQLGGFPQGHPGVPSFVSDNSGNRSTWNAADLKLGDSVLLDLTGKPASAYLKLFGPQVPEEGVGVLLEARVVSIDTDTIVADCQTTSSRNTDAARIVSVTSTFLRKKLQGPPECKSSLPPNANEKEQKVHEIQLRHASLPRLRVDSFDQTTIRVWTLDKEFTD